MESNMQNTKSVKKASSGAKMKISDSTTSKNRRNWDDLEKKEVLDCLLDTIRSGKLIEKPNASAYYDSVLRKMSFNDCTVSQLKNAVINMKRKYIAAKDWRGATGQGVLEEEGEESVLAALRKRCPFFDELDEIFGSRSSVTPPKVHDSADAGEAAFQEFAFNSQDIMVNSHSGTSNKGTEGAESEECSKPKKRKQSESGIEMLASSAKLRFEIQQGELAYQKEKLEIDRVQQDAKVQLERERFEFEKYMAERKLTLEEKKQEMEFEVAKFKIEKEIEKELKIELAKLSSSK